MRKWQVGLVLVFLLGGMMLATAETRAFNREEWKQRREQRRAELAARRAEREAKREQRRAEREAKKAERDVVKERCRCSASLSLARPSLQWRDGQLVFYPRVDVRIKSRGDNRDPWTARVDYTGQSSYKSSDVLVPTGTSFDGSQEMFSGMCGDDYLFKGWQLPAITLTGLNRELEAGEEIEGRVQMETRLSGCGNDQVKKSFSFKLGEWGNLRVRNWRRVR